MRLKHPFVLVWVGMAVMWLAMSLHKESYPAFILPGFAMHSAKASTKPDSTLPAKPQLPNILVVTADDSLDLFSLYPFNTLHRAFKKPLIKNLYQRHSQATPYEQFSLFKKWRWLHLATPSSEQLAQLKNWFFHQHIPAKGILLRHPDGHALNLEPVYVELP